MFQGGSLTRLINFTIDAKIIAKVQESNSRFSTPQCFQLPYQKKLMSAK